MDIKQVKEAIDALESIKTVDREEYDRALKVFRSLGKVPAVIDDIASGTRMLRTRCHTDAVLFTKVDEISTPPRKFVTQFGRCNAPDNPIFYCSEDRPTSYLELLHSWAEESDHAAPIYATIGAWYTKRPMKFLIIPSPDKHNRISRFDSYYGAAIDKEFDRMDRETRKAYSLYYRYLISKLTQSGKQNKLPYIVTSAYFECVCTEADKKLEALGLQRLDGIMYPSVENQGDSLNFAIRPEVITPANIELRTVYREAFLRVDAPPLVPSFTQAEQIESLNVDHENGEISWCSHLNKVLKPTFSRDKIYKLLK